MSSFYILFNARFDLPKLLFWHRSEIVFQKLNFQVAKVALSDCKSSPFAR